MQERDVPFISVGIWNLILTIARRRARVRGRERLTCEMKRSSISLLTHTFARGCFSRRRKTIGSGLDNCIFFIEAYGVLDDSGVLHSVSQFDPPFAQSNPDYLDSIFYFLA